MRSSADRIRHALAFEAIGLVLIVPLGSLALDKPAGAIGFLAITGSVAATIWTYLFTLGFDHALLRLRGTTARTLGLRVLYAVLFEGGLMAMLVPVTAWVLGVGIVEALLVDVGFALFYMAYAFVYNLVYDRLFPDPGAV